ncbi:MAG: class I SAM-dependent methyltransferase [Pseudomonadota bacterium]
MVTIYRDYQDEPKDVFLALPEELACSLYALEMESFSEDLVFFKRMLSPEGAVLELGCGTGRVARHLAKKQRPITGVDISQPMLRLAAEHQHPHCTYICMDMLFPAFRKPFDAIIIAYNTLNLLTTENKILRCLTGCGEVLHPQGTILVQLFIPTEDFRNNNHTTFQFQMFDRPGGGRIIKEILKKYQPESQTVQLEERYRIRPMQQGSKNINYHAISTLAGFNLSKWLKIFNKAQFAPVHIWGNYTGKPYDPALSSCCLLALERQ